MGNSKPSPRPYDIGLADIEAYKKEWTNEHIMGIFNATSTFIESVKCDPEDIQKLHDDFVKVLGS